MLFRSDPQLQSAYASCDIFALPSREEGFGIVYVEAMRHGKPCVGADSGGVPEVIDNGVCGLLVPYGNVPALAAAFERLYDDAELRLRFGEAGRRKAEAMFSRTAFGDACKQALQDVMRVSRAAR